MVFLDVPPLVFFAALVPGRARFGVGLTVDAVPFFFLDAAKEALVVLTLASSIMSWSMAAGSDAGWDASAYGMFVVDVPFMVAEFCGLGDSFWIAGDVAEASSAKFGAKNADEKAIIRDNPGPRCDVLEICRSTWHCYSSRHASERVARLVLTEGWFARQRLGREEVVAAEGDAWMALAWGAPRAAELGSPPCMGAPLHTTILALCIRWSRHASNRYSLISDKHQSGDYRFYHSTKIWMTDDDEA